MVVGYSRLMERDETGTLARLQAHRSELVGPLVKSHGGRIVKLMGDGVLVEFPSAVEAVLAAVEIQEGMARREVGRSVADRIALRIGINVGDIILDGDDIYGDGVNIAARLEGLAEPGGICVARSVVTQARNKLDLGFEPMGEQRVKNLAEPITAFRVRPGPGQPVVSKEASWRARPWPVAAAAMFVLIVAAAVAWLGPWPAPPQPPNAPIAVVEAAVPILDTRRLAVLPFANISADSEDEWFADGLTEEMIARLSMIPELSVIARTSITGYKGTSKGVTEIGRELGAGTILEGSVRRAGEQVRVTAQLIDSRSQAHLWAESYDRPLADIFAVQSDVATKVADALKIELLAEVKQRVDKPGTMDPVAHNLYLQGRHSYASGFQAQTIAHYEAAVSRDPSYAMAYAGLAEAWIDAPWGMPVPPRVALANATAAAEKALALDEDLAEAHAALAYHLRLLYCADCRHPQGTPQQQEAVISSCSPRVRPRICHAIDAARARLDPAQNAVCPVREFWHHRRTSSAPQRARRWRLR